MVKIREGYVMSVREKAEFDRVNALPRKKKGFVSYYFKPQTKYPPRIYVFMHSEIWCDRNRRPMGLSYSFPFLTRPMNGEELEYHHFDTRLCYHQYEDWDRLMNAEQKEAAQLNREKPGSGTAFIEKLSSFRDQFRLSSKSPSKTMTEEEQVLQRLISTADTLSFSEIGVMLREEQNGEKRLPVMILLRELFKNAALPSEQKKLVTKEMILRKAKVSEDRTRRNFVRRIYRKNKLFAMEEIRLRYPQYTETQLTADLVIAKTKQNRIKKVPYTDLRRCQLQKLAARIGRSELSDIDYRETCCRMVMLQQAHDLRLPIPLKVTFEKVTKVYSFGWRTRENVVKSFVQFANAKGMTHELLKEKHREMVSSNYS